MKINTHLAIILAALTGVTASVQAQDAAPANPPELSPAHKLKPFEKEFDANHDGKLDPTEKAAMISKYDKNGNGKIDKEELPAKKPHKDVSTNSATQ
jgi:Ca2+-binding EF-hand superfamily protein